MCIRDSPYTRAGRRAPDRPAVLIEAVGEGAAALAERAGVAPERVALGGRSMGGRMCSMAVAEGLPAAALVLVSYPLHPPGKPDKVRTDHFPALDLPCLFVSGTKDAFGSPDEPETAAVAASSSSGDPKASLVPDTNRHGRSRAGKWSVRTLSGLPGGCRG